jgi:tetratricopeptide (TPR) repeat protein
MMMKSLFLSLVCVGFTTFGVPASAKASGASHAEAALAEPRPIETVSDLPVASRMALFAAQELQDAGKPDEAAEEIRDFLKRNPAKDHYLIRFFLANSLSQQQKHAEALEEYEATVRLEPRHMQGWLNLGEMAYNLGRYERAAEAIRRGFDLSPEKPVRLLYYSAVAYLLAEKPDMAAPVLEELVSGAHGDPSLDWYKALVSVYLTLEDKGRGNETVGAMLERYPQDPEAWNVAFQYAASVSDYKQAAVALTIKGYLQDLTREERLQLGDLYSAIKDPARATSFYRSALVDSGSAKELERLASAYIAAYDTRSALETIERAIAEEPSARLWSLKGDLHYMEQDYARSYDAFGKCAELDPQNGRAYLMMGYCAIEMARYDEAIAKLELAAGFPEQEETALLLARRARLMGGGGEGVARAGG